MLQRKASSDDTILVVCITIFIRKLVSKYNRREDVAHMSGRRGSTRASKAVATFVALRCARPLAHTPLHHLEIKAS